MHTRYAQKVGSRLARNFSYHSQFTYFRQPSDHFFKRVTLIPGIFIGPEVTNSVVDCLEACNTPVTFDIITKLDLNNPEDKAKLMKNDVLMVGNLGTEGSRYIENMKIYKALDLRVHMVHLTTMPNVQVRHKNVDLIVVRENLEGEYSGIEHEVYPGVFESLKVVTKTKAQTVADFTFQHALLTGRKKVTCVHKANIMKMVDGLFLECAREAAKKFPTIEFEEMIVDNTCMQLVKNPSQFDVMLMPNLYGSIIQSIGAGLVGGAGVTAGAAYGPKYMMFEPGTRKSGLTLTGQNLANPTSLLLASTNMLHNLGLPRFASLIKQAIRNVYQEGKYLTKDVGGQSSTSDFTKRVIAEIKALDKGIKIHK